VLKMISWAGQVELGTGEGRKVGSVDLEVCGFRG
jgi:hypothetical protein